MTQPIALWQQLQQAGLVTGQMPALEPSNPQPALFLRILLGISGWLTALFFCGFIASIFASFLAQASSIWILGLILCAISIGLSRLANLPLFLEQFVFACSLAGQAFIVFGVWESSASSQLTAACMLVVELFLFAAIGMRSLRATAVFLACAALVWLLDKQAWLYALPLLSAAAIGLQLNSLRRFNNSAYWQPASTGLTLALWAIIFLALLGNSTEFTWLHIAEDNWHRQLWLAAALTSLVCLLLAWQLIRRYVQHAQLTYIALFVSFAIGLVNLTMPGIAPLCLLLCIGVALAKPRLIWLNLLLLGVYLLLYYYNLNNSLLYKSIVLCLSGSALLLLYALLNRSAHLLSAEPEPHA